MTRFVSLAVFALMAMGVFGAEVAAQGFTWDSAAPDPAQPAVLKVYPWWEQNPNLTVGSPGSIKRKTGKGSVIFAYDARMPANKWTVTAARVQVFRADPATGLFGKTADDAIVAVRGAVVVNAAGSSTIQTLTFDLPTGPGSSYGGYNPGEMVQVDVLVTASNPNGGSLTDYLISRSTLSTTP